MNPRIHVLLVLSVAAIVGGRTAAHAQQANVSNDLAAVPLPAALTRLQDASGLHLAFAADLVKDAEPVTLSARDEPVDSVLHRILRPRGMEFICTAETMAAIVPAHSEMAMAKAAGRAIRTLARLARKLDGAVQEGDEVRVPGWEEGDDRALAEGIADLVCAFRYFSLRKWLRGNAAAVCEALGSYDADVRAGAAVPAIVFAGGNVMLYAETDALAQPVLAALDDPDPFVRASGLLAAGHLRAFAFQLWPAVRHRAMSAGANDPAPEVRVAAAIVASREASNDPGGAILAALRSDASATVRAAAWGLSFPQWPRRGMQPPPPESLTKAIATEKNPILRSLGAVQACKTWRKDADRLRQIAASPGAADDQWLTLTTDVIAASAGADRAVPAPDNGAAAAAGAVRRPAIEREAMIGTLAAMIGSGKRSHQALAAGVLAMAIRWLGEGGSARPDFSPLAAFADSDCLWARLAGIAASGACRGDAAEARLLQALDSPDDLDRLAALAGLTAPRAPEREGAELPAIAAAPRAALVKALRSPRYSERAAAAVAIFSRMQFDDAMAVFQDDLRREPRSGGGEAMIAAFPHMAAIAQEMRDQRRMMLLDALLDSGDAGLQSLALRSAFWFPSQPMLLTMICEMEPEAFFDLAASENWAYELSRRDFAVQAILERFRSLFENRAPGDFSSVRALALFMDHPDGTFHGINRGSSRPFPNAVGNVVGNWDLTPHPIVVLCGAMLTACTAGGAGDGALGAAVQLLNAYFGQQYGHATSGVLTRTLPGIRDATAWVLAHAGHRTLGPKIAILLGSCYQARYALKNDAGLLAAMDDARRRIMASDRPADQALLLCGMVMARPDFPPDPAAEAFPTEASAELQRRLIAGAVPGNLRFPALWAMRFQPRDITPAFGRFLAERLVDPAESPDLKDRALPIAARHCPLDGPLVDVLGN